MPVVDSSKMGRPPRPRNSSLDLNQQRPSISVVKPVKSVANMNMKLQPPFLRRRVSYDVMAETPFEAHLADIYAGRASPDDGLSFFESHGYYDLNEANTIAMFRQNFGMKKQFWDGGDNDVLFYEEVNLNTVDLAGLQVISVGSMLNKDLKRTRTTSGRFRQLDDQGNEVDAEAQLEAEREKRMKLKHLEVDEDDLAELAQEQIVLAKAISVIRTEKTRFHKYFDEACNDQMNRHAAASTERAVIPQPTPSLSIQLPPYSGYLYLLKDTIPHLFRSWRKRWFYLDFNAGLVRMYKRSYWKSPRGSLDMRSVVHITRMNQSDICIQCYDGRSMLLRSKVGSNDADLWVNLLQFARRQVGNVTAPAAPGNSSSSTAMTTTTTTMMTTTMMTSSFTNLTGPNGFLVSTKIGTQTERSVFEVMSVVLQAGKAPNAITAA